MAKRWRPWIRFQTRHPTIASGMSELWAVVRPYLPPVNFITVHHAYFIFGALIFAVIFWCISHPSRSVSFTDSLFLVASAFTASGLNTVNTSQLTTGQQVILAIMMILGSPIVISLFTIGFRAHIFEQRFEDIVKMERNRKMQTTGTLVGMAGAMFATPVMSSFRRGKGGKSPGPVRRGTWKHTQRAEADAFRLGSPRLDQRAAQPSGRLPSIQEPTMPQADHSDASARPYAAFSPASSSANRRWRTSRDEARPTTANMFDFGTFISDNKKSIGRNGQFFDLTEKQREFLGGVEYRALRILFVLISVYFVVFQVLGAIALGAWMSVYGSGAAAANFQNPWWAGVFLCISSFNNAGMTLLDAGIAAFDGDAFVLTVVTVLALAGNYAFPAFIRVTVSLCSFILKRITDDGEYAHLKDALAFILKYPRRLFMLMFPSRANWVFVAICTSLGVLNWVMLLILSIGNSILETYPLGQRVGLALFQALTIPSGGYTVVSASGLYFDVQVLWVLMMYIAAYPEIIVMRNSNVYEERSLGIYTSNNDKDDDGSSEKTISDEDALLPPLAQSGQLHRTPVPYASSQFSTQSIQKLTAVGRRGTAFVGRQIQKRVNNFQGVGVSPRPQLRRATVIDFDSPTTTTAPAAAVAADEGHLDLVTQHLRSQLSHDMWFIALALFLVTLIETSHSVADAQAYSVFNFLFEIVSGYTNIGLSIGLPGESFSFSGGWYIGSKLVLVLMMIRGRHRGLPVALDHAVKLPGWDNVKKQQEDAEIRRSIGRSRASLDVPVSA